MAKWGFGRGSKLHQFKILATEHEKEIWKIMKWLPPKKKKKKKKTWNMYCVELIEPLKHSNCENIRKIVVKIFNHDS